MHLTTSSRSFWMAALALLLFCLATLSVQAVTNPVDTPRSGMIWTQTAGGTATEDFLLAGDVYLNGGADAGGHLLSSGYYYVMVSTDDLGTNRIANSYPVKPVNVISGVFAQPYKLLGAGGIFPSLLLQANVYYYVWIGKNPFTYSPCYAETERCRFRITEESESGLIAYKFKDVNRDGKWEPNAPNYEPPIQKWQILVFDSQNNLVGSQFTDIDGRVVFILDPGTYKVQEVMQAGWAPTTATEFVVEVPENGVGGPVYFGNIQVGNSSCAYAAPVYYWYSEKGKAKFLTDEQGNLDALVALNLVDAAGNPFDPADYPSVAKWLANVYYTNDAYALSVQLAVMVLNKRAGFVSGSAVIYNSTLGFITIDNLIAAADAALAADGYTPVGDPNRATQDVLRKALTAANNNQNFVLIL